LKTRLKKIKRKIGQTKQPDDQLKLELEQIKDGDLLFQLKNQSMAAEPPVVLHLALLLLELKSKPAAAAKSNATTTKQYQGSNKRTAPVRGHRRPPLIKLPR
jgi:hypothetical protein